VNVEETFNSISFTVAALPQGLEILNMVNVSRDSGETATRNFLPGDIVSVFYIDAITLNIVETSEPDHFAIIFDGSVQSVNINSEYIPEFPPILAVPLFMTATLLALIYRRKRASQTTD
jgi:hypothetical protein